LSVTKIHSRKVQRDFTFVLSDDLIEQLHMFEKQMGWRIFDILEVLKDQKADSLSITKEKPFSYFYARVSGKTVTIRLENLEGQTEFKIPLEELI